MSSKFLEGLSMVIGMCILMHALFSEDRSQTSEHKLRDMKPARGAVPGKRKQVAYMAFGSSLLIYGMAEVVLRGR